MHACQTSSIVIMSVVLNKHQVPVVRRLDNTIYRIIRFPVLVDSAVCFVNTYPPDSDLSGGLRYQSSFRTDRYKG